MPTFGALDATDVVKMLAAGSLTQLYRNAAFPRAGVSSLQADDLAQYFEYGQATSISRPKLTGAAEDFNPRGGSDASSAEPGNVITSLTLEKLYTAGYPIYAIDADVERYMRDYSASTVGAIRQSIDDYFYDKAFRGWSGLATSGTVSLSTHPPLQVVWRETASALTGLTDTQLVDAGAVLSKNEVPESGRYARVSHYAASSLTKDITPVTSSSIVSGGSDFGTGLVINGMNSFMDIPYRGFMLAGSNAVTGQAAVADTGDGVATEPLGAAVADTTLFLDGDQSAATPIGAVRFTIDQTANLAAGIAVGKIARIAVTSGNAAVAYGVILRVSAADKYVWMVPYSSTGVKLVAADFTTSQSFSVPAIGAVNCAFHQEHLVFANRLLRPPTVGSGAIAESAVDLNSGLVLQIFKGSYIVDRFRESIRSASLIGAQPTDLRKATLILSNA